MTDPEPAITLAGLSRSFGDIVAVDGLTFQVHRGELLGLAGPDGAGKTTTLRMLAAILRPDRGEATVNGTSVVHHPEKVKHDIAYMPQRFGLYADLTVIENINFYADLYLVPGKLRPGRLERLFAFSHLGPFKDRLAGALSGGMKQKLGLCCALIHQPQVLLLDEPTRGVDPISRRDLWMIIHEMVARGTTVMVSTSYMDEAERCDRVALLYRGCLQAIDTPVALRRRLPGEILVVQTQNVLHARKIALRIPGVHSAAVFGQTLHLNVESAEKLGPLVRAELNNSGFAVRKMHTAVPGMEDIFIEFMTQAQGGQDE